MLRLMTERPLPCLTPQVRLRATDKTHMFNICRESRICSCREKLGQAGSVTMMRTGGDEGEEVKASDIVPEPTDPHASRERVVVRKCQQFEYSVKQFRREEADGPQ